MAIFGTDPSDEIGGALVKDCGGVDKGLYQFTKAEVTASTQTKTKVLNSTLVLVGRDFISSFIILSPL